MAGGRSPDDRSGRRSRDRPSGREGRAAVERFYDRIAAVYDLLATAPPVVGWRERAIEALALAPGETVVEMGCGTGANLRLLREAVGPDGTVVGIDLTPGMLRRARERVERAGWSNVHLVRADATRPPVAAADGLLASFVVGLLPDPSGTVDPWLDVLGPGGRAAILEAGRTDRTLARPLNLGFRAFVRMSSASGRTSTDSPAVVLDDRIAAAGQALAARTVDRHYETVALGFVRVLSGRITGDRPGEE